MRRFDTGARFAGAVIAEGGAASTLRPATATLPRPSLGNCTKSWNICLMRSLPVDCADGGLESGGAYALIRLPYSSKSTLSLRARFPSGDRSGLLIAAARSRSRRSGSFFSLFEVLSLAPHMRQIILEFYHLIHVVPVRYRDEYWCTAVLKVPLYPPVRWDRRTMWQSRHRTSLGVTGCRKEIAKDRDNCTR